MEDIDMPKPQEPTTNKTEFQVLLHLGCRPNEDEDLEAIAEVVSEALKAEAAGLALGPVVGIDLDERIVEIEMTVEAPSASEVHQKMGLILAAIERGVPNLRVQDSSASRSRVDEPEPAFA